MLLAWIEHASGANEVVAAGVEILEPHSGNRRVDVLPAFHIALGGLRQVAAGEANFFGAMLALGAIDKGKNLDTVVGDGGQGGRVNVHDIIIASLRCRSKRVNRPRWFGYPSVFKIRGTGLRLHG